MNNGQSQCIICGCEFTYNVAFFRERGYNKPKRCPKCAAGHRNRRVNGKKRCLLQLGSVQLDIPDEFVDQRTFLTRVDGDKEFITCNKFKICPKGQYRGSSFTVYDHRNNGKKIEPPLSGEQAKASLRVMAAAEGYEYIVLDTPEYPMAEATLVVTSKIIEQPSVMCLWYYFGVSGVTKWLLKVILADDALGDKIWLLLQKDM